MIEIPVEIKAVLSAGIGFLVTEGLKGLSELLGKDLTGNAAAIAAALLTAVFLFLDGLLAVVPAEYAQVAQTVLMLIGAILGAFGIHRQAKRFSK